MTYIKDLTNKELAEELISEGLYLPKACVYEASRRLREQEGGYRQGLLDALTAVIPADALRWYVEDVETADKAKIIEAIKAYNSRTINRSIERVIGSVRRNWDERIGIALYNLQKIRDEMEKDFSE